MKIVWSMALVVTGVALGCVLLCIAPFVAVAVLAARTLSPRNAALVIAAMWLGNEAIGFGLQAYPHDALTIAWGGVLLATALLAAIVARRIAHPVLAGAAAFVTYEGAQFAFALPTGTAGDYSLAIDAQVLAANLLAATILIVVRFALVTARRRAILGTSRR